MTRRLPMNKIDSKTMSQADEKTKPFSLANLISLAIVFLLVCGKLWLVSDQRIVALYLPYDDLLFVKLAESISLGHWLGDYDHLTLVKVPGYPMWIALMKYLGIPILFSQHLIYLISLVLICIILISAGVSRIALFLGIMILLFSPESFSNDQLRLSRMYLYDAFTLLLFSLWFITIHLFRWRYLFPMVVAYSCILAYYSLIREEFIWIIPVYVVLVLLFYMKHLHQGLSLLLSRTIILVVIPIVTVVGCDRLIRLVNEHHYGVAVLHEQRDGYFPAAIGALYRINSGKQIRYVPVPKKARDLAYQVSPSFRQVEALLEGDIGEAWIKHGCNFSEVCDDIVGGLFFWAVRDTVYRLGYYDNAKKAESFYKAIADEINSACKVKAIPCGPQRSTLRPVFRKCDIIPWISSFIDGMSHLWHPPASVTTESLQSDSLALTDFYELFPGEVNLPRYSQFDAEYYVKKNPDIAVMDIDPFEHYMVWGRFEGREPNDKIRGIFDAAHYLATNPDVAAIGIDPYQHYMAYGQFEGRSPSKSEDISFISLKPLGKKLDSLQYRIRNILRSGYLFLSMIFSVCGLIILARFLFHVIRNRPIANRELTAGLILFLTVSGIISRVALMSFFDATTYPGFGGYLLPAYGLFSVFCSVATVYVFDAVFVRR